MILLESIRSSFEQIVEPYLGGSPQNSEIVWTALRPKEIQQKLESKGLRVSYYIASQLLSNAN